MFQIMPPLLPRQPTATMAMQCNAGVGAAFRSPDGAVVSGALLKSNGLLNDPWPLVYCYLVMQSSGANSPRREDT